MKKNIELYKITDEVAEYYRLNVKNNRETPTHMIIKKLTRNVLLADKLPIKTYNKINTDNDFYAYGQMLIEVEPETHMIVEISNYTQGVNPYWHKDMKKYEMLNKILGITEGLDKLTNVM